MQLLSLRVNHSTVHSRRNLGLAFVLDLCYAFIMIESPPPLETAEARAKRIWNNQQIIMKIRDENTKPAPAIKQRDEPAAAAVARAFRKAIHEVFITNKK